MEGVGGLFTYLFIRSILVKFCGTVERLIIITATSIYEDRRKRVKIFKRMKIKLDGRNVGF